MTPPCARCKRWALTFRASQTSHRFLTTARDRRSVGACRPGIDQGVKLGWPVYTGSCVPPLPAGRGRKLFLKGDRCHTPKCAIERRGDRGGARRPRLQSAATNGIRHSASGEAERLDGSTACLSASSVGTIEWLASRAVPVASGCCKSWSFRADSVVYRMGFGLSRAHARQLIQHGHIEFEQSQTRHSVSRLARRRPGSAAPEEPEHRFREEMPWTVRRRWAARRGFRWIPKRSRAPSTRSLIVTRSMRHSTSN